jgi:hypothetical protein
MPSLSFSAASGSTKKRGAFANFRSGAHRGKDGRNATGKSYAEQEDRSKGILIELIMEH